MLRKQQERSAQGKRSAFRVGGMEVGMHKIIRAARRSRITVSGSSPEPGESGTLSLQAIILVKVAFFFYRGQIFSTHLKVADLSVETPSDISCYTPVDRPSTPETQAFDETSSFSQSSSYSQPAAFPQHTDFSQPPPVPYYGNHDV